MTVFGAGGGTSSYREIEDADLIVFWGSNAREAHPIFFQHALKGIHKGAKVYAVDPRRSKTAEWADTWLGLDVGTDVALAYGVGREIIHAGLVNEALPLQPGLLDPVFSGGIFAGLTATFWGRSRRSAFIAGLLGVLLVDLASVIQLLLQGVEEQLTLGSGGLFSSMVLSAFLAVIITEVIGEVREALHLGGGQNG